MLEVLIGTALLNPDGPAEERQMAAFIADLSMQKKSEEVLRRTEKLAVAGRLAASISHEINNPLEAITNCLYLLSNTELAEESRYYLELAQKELDRVAQITVQTLRFYRASTRPTRTDVRELVATVLALLDSRFRQQRIEVVRDLRSNLLIVAHEGEIRQVLVNLINNAIDAVGEDGCVIVRTARARDWALNRKGLAITVADNGTGMDAATRERIFEPFFSTKGITGTGLGLWISKEIAGKHQGRIRVRSRLTSCGTKGGTVFRFFIPAQEEPGAKSD
jgi:signal transduction histidine kinase